MFRDKRLFLTEKNFKKQLILNKTYLFLIHVLQDYGDRFIRNLFTDSGLVACGIGDAKYNMVEGVKIKYCLFLLHDSTKCGKFIKLLRQQNGYINDYPLELRDNSSHHFSVIKIPAKYYKAYDKFIENRFSEMYTKEEIKELRLSKNNKDTRELYYILTRDPEYFSTFVEKVNMYFNATVKLALDEVKEFALPISMDQEVFFHYLDRS